MQEDALLATQTTPCQPTASVPQNMAEPFSSASCCSDPDLKSDDSTRVISLGAVPSFPCTTTSSSRSFATFERTIALNNAGAILMEQEDYPCAIRTLERAFFTFKRAYRSKHGSLPSSYTSTCDSSTTNSATMTSVDDLFSWNKRHGSTKCNQVTLDDVDADEAWETPTVYNNPIYLPADFSVTRESCGFLSTAISLNLAMSHHSLVISEKRMLVRTKKSDKSSTKENEHLDAATQLYEYTIRLESARARQYQTQPPPTARTRISNVPSLFVSPFALMIILNNTGHVHAMMQQSELSQRYYRRLQAACMYLMVRVQGQQHSPQQQSFLQQQQQRLRRSSTPTASTNTAPILGTTMSPADLQIFLHNVNLGLRLIHRHSAPAA